MNCKLCNTELKPNEYFDNGELLYDGFCRRCFDTEWDYVLDDMHDEIWKRVIEKLEAKTNRLKEEKK